MSEITKGALVILGELAPGQRFPISVTEDGTLIALISGEDGEGTAVPLKVDSNGNLMSIISGENDVGATMPVKINSAGAMETILYGDCAGTDTPVMVSDDGRIMADMDLLESMILDFDTYAQGCNARRSLGVIGDITFLVYLINAYNGLFIIRYISALGSSSSPGSYSISMGGPDTLVGVTSINESIIDHHMYRKTLVDCSFGITTTDCTISDILIDVARDVIEASEITHVSGTPLSNSFADEDDSTFDTLTSTGENEILSEISFDASTIKAVSVANAEYVDVSGNYSLNVQLLVNGAWVNVSLSWLAKSSLYADRYYSYDHWNGSWNNVTGLRLLGNKIGAIPGGVTIKNITLARG